MTFTPGDPFQDLTILFRIEVGLRLDGESWTQAAAPNDDCWYVPHTSTWLYGERQGKPARVKENGTEYTERASLADCQADASSWYWDATNKRLYVQTSGSDDPGGGSYILMSYPYRRFANRAVVFDGKPYLPFLKRETISPVTYATGGFHEGGTKQSIGRIALFNHTGFFDSDLSAYVYEGKRFTALVKRRADPDADYSVYWDGWTGGVEWSDEAVEIEIEDLMTGVI